MAKIIKFSNSKQDLENDPKPGLITSETFWRINSVDKTGIAITLYLFYAQKAIDQNSPQPLATDQYCADSLNRSLSTIRRARKKLEQVGVIEPVRKRTFTYIRINYLPFRIEGPSHNLSAENIPQSLMGTYVVFDYFTTWHNRILNNPLPFIRKVNKSANRNFQADDILTALYEIIDSKIEMKGYGIEKVENELAYFHYLVEAVKNKLLDGAFRGATATNGIRHAM
jgi:hypothetical protein